MLAVQTAMDPLRHSKSEQRSLLREPSAEDLDAAHQLVSSARGERKNPPPPTPQPDHMVTGTRNLSIRNLTNNDDDPEPEPERIVLGLQDREAGGFSQIRCR
jgi:hypothetical protein